MKRIHLFEFEDLPWFPSGWRDYGTDYLKFIATKFDIYKPIIPLLQKALNKSGKLNWVDLASGGGSGLTNLAKILHTQFPNLKITLTDYYPNISAFEQLKCDLPNVFLYEKNPVDATNPPSKFDNSLKTIFGGFHHFRPSDAVKILQNVVDTNTSIAIFEPVGRNIGSWFSMLFVPINVLVLTLFMRPVRWSVLPFIYLIPLIPLYILWDGIISILRTYSSEELKSMIRKVNNSETYNWEIGQTSGAMPIYYLLAYKKEEEYQNH